MAPSAIPRLPKTGLVSLPMLRLSGSILFRRAWYLYLEDGGFLSILEYVTLKFLIEQLALTQANSLNFIMVLYRFSYADALLSWFDDNARNLPWREKIGEKADPYRVWVSEIMLQQTTVAAVIPYFNSFMARWPSVHELSRAPLDEILHAWQGLGYYSRARNLHQCAKYICEHLKGIFPSHEETLCKLPGIGPYTAAAIVAIAYGQKATPIDTNVERVVTRIHALKTPLPKAKREIKALAKMMTPDRRPGDYAQAIMDLGAGVCRPRAPNCGFCPLKDNCLAFKSGEPTLLPHRLPKNARLTRHGTVFWTARKDAAVLVRRRAERGLLGGMMEFPSTPWVVSPVPEIRKHEPFPGDWQPLPGEVAHIFSHFRLVLRVVSAVVEQDNCDNGQWCMPDDFGKLALPTVMKKVALHVSKVAAVFPRSDTLLSVERN
tara:strand:- start:3462 stop:4760 length:1299 start_codon:yes stop_codon:yes gene_type:complete